jgi:hypothetical protein
MSERWMLNTDPQLRNRLSGLFSARIVELQFAEWIEATRGMAIVSLEATLPGPDIEARDASGAAVAFELKAIGIPYDDFEIILQSISDGPSGRAISPYAAINFMLFRIYEAAKQLAHFNGRRIAVVVIGDDRAYRFDFQLRGSWIDWSNPTFLAADRTWENFLARQERENYPDIRTDVGPTLRAIDESRQVLLGLRLITDDPTPPH